MMKIGLYGGSFDPVHRGHTGLAAKAVDALNLDKLIFIPTPKNPLKSVGPVATNAQRTEMLKLAIGEDEKFSVSEVEVGADMQQTGPVYSIDTVVYYAGLHELSKEQLFFLIGADSIENLHQWKDYQRLFDLSTVTVIGRDGLKKTDILAVNPELTDVQVQDLENNFIEFSFPASSTEIREAFKRRLPEEIADKLAPEVLEYIRANRIYSDS